MENKLKSLFDFQKFHENQRLAEMIAEAENTVDCQLSDDELFQVSAAGDLSIPKKEDVGHDS